MDMRDDVPAPGGAAFRSRTYATDLTDAEWQHVQHLIEVTQTGPGPRRSVDLRAVLNAVRYKQHTGCQWRNLPADMPPRSTVHGYYRRWKKSGILAQIDALLPQQSFSFAVEEPQTIRHGSRPWVLQPLESAEATPPQPVSSR